jgi:AraC-like DNA-binding protein
MEAIAGKMGLSRQTLFRKLKAEGVTFADGFSEPAAFSRAFKRWTGSSPRTALASTLGRAANHWRTEQSNLTAGWITSQ